MEKRLKAGDQQHPDLMTSQYDPTRIPWIEPMHDPFQAMGHPVRRFLVNELVTGEACAGELAERVQLHFGIGWPAVSKHLKMLHEAGFVRVRRSWSSRIYRLDDEAIDKLECRVIDLRMKWSLRRGAGYRRAIEPEEAPWPRPKTKRRPVDEDEALERILSDQGRVGADDR